MKQDETQTNGQRCTDVEEVERLRRRITELETIQAEYEDSQERYQALVENLSDVLYAVDERGRITYISPAVEPLSGYTAAELLGRSLFEFLYPDDTAAARESFPHALYEHLEPIECRVLTKAGEVRWVQSSRKPIIQGGRTRGIRGVITDITKRKQTEQALQDSEQRYRRLVENSLGLICTHDLEGTVLSVNPAVAQSLGYQAGEGVGSSLRTFLAPEVRPLFDEYLARIRRHGRDRGYMRVLTKTGEERVWEYRNVCCEEAGRPPYVLGHAQDVTERIQAEEELRQAHAELEQRVQERTAALAATNDTLRLEIAERKKAEAAMLQAKEAAETANRLKSEFLATMSHELRTPLHIILGYLEILKEEAAGLLPDQAVFALERIREKTFELFELITAVLDVSRLEAGRMSVDLQTVQLAELLASLQEELQDLQTTSSLSFVWRSAAELPSLTTDAAKLKIILKNLITNAVKFANQGSLTVAAQRSLGGIEIRVTDTGVGIPAEALTTIFEPFRQLDGSDTRRQGGVGLGLHIVKRTVELLQGTITVESEVGRGSTFRVWLPVGSPAEQS